MTIKFNRNMDEAPRTGGAIPHTGPKLLLLYPKGRFRIGCWDEDVYVKKPKPYWSTSYSDKRNDQASTPIGWCELVAEPVVWIGEGAPPVGITCEVKNEVENCWDVADEILAHTTIADKPMAVFKKGNQVFYSPVAHFRPIDKEEEHAKD